MRIDLSSMASFEIAMDAIARFSKYCNKGRTAARKNHLSQECGKCYHATTVYGDNPDSLSGQAVFLHAAIGFFREGIFDQAFPQERSDDNFQLTGNLFVSELFR